VVPAQKKEVLRVFHLKSEQEQYCLDLHWTTSLVVTEEKVVGIWRPALFVEYLSEIHELTVNITYNFDGWL